jgi:hypothetical protein
MAIQVRPFRRASAAERKRAQAYLRSAGTAGESSIDPVSEAEACVARHPESAVWTAFGLGVLLGAAAGWMAAERHEQHWYGRLDDYMDVVRRRFHW